jgi:hypothetical protein
MLIRKDSRTDRCVDPLTQMELEPILKIVSG